MVNKNILIFVLVVVLVMTFSGEVLGATINAASCEQVDVQAAIGSAVDGDTVLVPAGICTWGASATYVSVNKAITLQGAGQGQTIINISPTAGSWTSGTIRISSAATVKDFSIQTNISGNSGTAFSVSGNGFRITNINYQCRTTSINGYFAYVGSYGLIDNCDITSGAGNNELIFARGPTDSWQTENSIGGADNLFIENNAFHGSGAVCDINANGRAVIRHNLITGNMKIDGHGKASNSPPRGFRHMEVYENLWTSTSNFWVAITFRGGTGVAFNNRAEPGNTGIWFQLTDYGYTTTWPNFNNTCQCPSDYPVDDQIGVGQDPKVAASEPLYLWNNTRSGESWPFSFPSTSTCEVTCGVFVLQDVIQENIDYYNGIPKPGYTPYTYPHPLAIPECSDSIDNDGDGQIDLLDQGCDNAEDDDETNCGDGFCEGVDNCETCVVDCPTGAGEVCCSRNLYTGDCCDDNDCVSSKSCIDHVCSVLDFCSDLSLLMHFDSDSSVVQDFSGNGNNGTATDTTWTSSGKFLGAFDFEGSQGITVPNDVTLNNPEITISLWVKQSGDQGVFTQIIRKADSYALEQGWRIGADWTAANNNFNLQYMRNLTTVAPSYLFTLNQNQWYHLAFAGDSSGTNLYFDGVLHTSGVEIYPSSTQNLIIGDNPQYQPFNGTIDEVAIWNRSLSADEISYLYNSGVPITCETTTCSSADTDTDGVVSILEVMAYITEWKAGSVDIISLMTGITEWKSGCT